MTLSRVKQLENLHLIAFHEEAIKVSSKCLQEINRLRQRYRPDLPQYTVPRQFTTQTRKRKLAGSLSTRTTETPSAKRSKRSAVKRKAPAPVPSQTPKVEGTPPVPKRKRVSPPPPPQTAPPGDGKCNKKGAIGPKGKAPPPRAVFSTSKCEIKKGIELPPPRVEPSTSQCAVKRGITKYSKCHKKGAIGPKGKAPPPRAVPSTSKCAVKKGIELPPPRAEPSSPQCAVRRVIKFVSRVHHVLYCPIADTIP